jgi:hypothetical protein
VFFFCDRMQCYNIDSETLDKCYKFDVHSSIHLGRIYVQLRVQLVWSYILHELVVMGVLINQSYGCLA